MAIAHMLGWWYSQGWSWLVSVIVDNLKSVKDTFSVTILLRTLFSPWKQIQSPSSFSHFFQSALDNLISRLVGATVRIFMLLSAFFLTVAILAIGLVIVVVWPLFPLLVILLPLAAVTV